MTTYKETFAGTEDRSRVLSEVLRHGPAVPGTTLIALIDRSTQAVLAVRSLPTQVPILDEELYFDDEQRFRLSSALRAIAEDVAPPRPTGRGRWGEITGELITVVCREGIAAITPIEVQYFWGWRYSNHLTAAFDGDVYVVTPQGWANLAPEYSGAEPALPADPDGLGTAAEVQDAERVLAEASLALLGPEPGECVLCYVHRMLVEFGCNGRLRFATHYRDVRAPRATGLERRLGRVAACDCEIFLNSYGLQQEHWVPDVASRQDELDDDEDEERARPSPLPACTQVRAGSTQPCWLWSRLVRW